MKMHEFKVGDHVYSTHFGEGIITEIDERKRTFYPINVEWLEELQPYHGLHDTFMLNGQYAIAMPDEEFDIVPVVEDGGEEMGQIAGVINHNIAKKMKEDNEKMGADDEIFHVGDHVWSPHFGAGIVTDTNAAEDENAPYPIKVEWCHSGDLCTYDCFTKEGQFDPSGANPDMAIYSVEVDHASKVISNLINALTKKDEGTVERMEDGLNKKVEDAVNPSHYRVEGLPEAIDIINHLMHREQYEGFLWGNILKYAYRYGLKGDKAETAGKIAWYANQLKDLEEEKHNET